MIAHDRTSAREVRFVREVDALGELNDPPRGEVTQDALAKTLLPRPEVAEVATAVEEQQHVVPKGSQVLAPVVGGSAFVYEIAASLREPLTLGQPDGAIADVCVVGITEQSATRTGGYQIAQNAVYGEPKTAQRPMIRLYDVQQVLS